MKPSIRKQFLSRIYERNQPTAPEYDSTEKSSEPDYLGERSFISNFSEISNAFEQKSTPDKDGSRCITPSLQSSRRSQSSFQEPYTMQIFIDFLKSLQSCNNHFSPDILENILPVTKALNDNFSKNPEFSLQFYISMSEIINALEDPDSIHFGEFVKKIEEALNLTNESIAEIEQLEILKKHISKVSLKIINVFHI